MRKKFTSSIKYSLLIVEMVFAVNSIHAQIQKGFDIDGEAAYDNSGYSVSMPDVNTIAIGAIGNSGAAGQTRIFTWNGSAWEQKGIDIDGEVAIDQSGRSISMPDANTIAISAPENDGTGNNAGKVKMYTWNGSAWVQIGNDLTGEDAGDYFGFSLSMPDMNTVAIGAIRNSENGFYAGDVRIFEWNGSAWVQKGSDVEGETAGDNSGYSVSMPDANTVAIGANQNDGNGVNAGHVRVFTWDGSAWGQKGNDIDGEAADDESGYTVSMPDANTVAIGAPKNDDNGSNAGHVRIYSWNGSTWVQKGNDIDGEIAYEESGRSISMPDANTIGIGVPYGDGIDNNSGLVRIFKWNGSEWVQKGVNILGETSNNFSGWSVSMPDDNTIGIGTPYNDGIGNDAGHGRIYSICSPLTGTESVTACNSYDWIDGNTYTSSNITATHTLTSANGCDSVVTLNLTINTVDFSVTNNTPTLSANQTGANYQWIDCNNGNTAIAGETNQSFTATTNGNYAVIVTQNGCSDTSTCVAINTIGVQENNLSDELLIYPNPSNGEFTIGGLTIGTTIELSNAIGIVVLRLTTEDTTIKIDLSKHANGVYLIKTTNGYTYKLVKQD